MKNRRKPWKFLLASAPLAALAAACQPTANAGPDQVAVNPPKAVRLDGSGSSDPNGFGLGYLWTLDAKPAGSAAAIAPADAQLPNPTFTADVGGTYTASLRVSNGLVPSEPDSVTVTVPTVRIVSPASGAEIVGLAVNVDVSFAGLSPGAVSVSLDGVDVTQQLTLQGDRFTGLLTLADRDRIDADGAHSLIATGNVDAATTVSDYVGFFATVTGLHPLGVELTTENAFLWSGNGASSSTNTGWVSFLEWMYGIGYGSSLQGTVFVKNTANGMQAIDGERAWTRLEPPPTISVGGEEVQLPRVARLTLVSVLQFGRPNRAMFVYWIIDSDRLLVYFGGGTVRLYDFTNRAAPVVRPVPYGELVEHLSLLAVAANSGPNGSEPPPPPPPQANPCKQVCVSAMVGQVVLGALTVPLAPPLSIVMALGGAGAGLAAVWACTSCTLCSFHQPGCGSPLPSLENSQCDNPASCPPPDHRSDP